MASIYDDAAQLVLDLLAELGTDASIRRIGNDYTPATGEAVEATKLSGTLRVLILPLAATPTRIFGEADNKLIEDLIGGKLRFVIAAAKGAPFEPVANDLLQIGNETFTVKGCTPLSPAGIPILYKMGAVIAPAVPSDAAVPELTAIEQAAGDVAQFSDQ